MARTRDPARIAELEAEMGQLFLNHFARLERAVRTRSRPASWPRSTSAGSSRPANLPRLGDYRAVVRLYELELEGTQRRPPARRPAAGSRPRARRKIGGARRGRPAPGRGGAAASARRKGAGAAGGGLRGPELDRRRRRRPGGSHLLSDSAPPAGGRATPKTPSRRSARRWGRSGARRSSELLERVYYDERTVPGAGSLFTGSAFRRRDRRNRADRLSYWGPSWRKASSPIEAEAHPGLRRDLAARTARKARRRKTRRAVRQPARTTPSWRSCVSGSSGPSPIRPRAPD